MPIAGSINKLISGFALTDYSTSNYISSSNMTANIHSYLTLANRGSNVNSYAVNSDLNQLTYDYFYKLVENDLQTVGDGGELKPSLSTWTTAAWWKNDETNFVKVNGNLTIDETQAFNLTNNQSLVVFVDGNLTLNNSQTADTNYKITSVAQGGFLAFFVNGDILISADVGYELDPANPTVPVVSVENSNIEGVFVTDGDLIIQSKNAVGEVPPDRKFIGAGTFVGWHGVNLDRTFDDNGQGPILNQTQAVENFIYRPDFLANWPTKLKTSVSNWHEINPQLISQ